MVLLYFEDYDYAWKTTINTETRVKSFKSRLFPTGSSVSLSQTPTTREPKKIKEEKGVKKEREKSEIKFLIQINTVWTLNSVGAWSIWHSESETLKL